LQRLLGNLPQHRRRVETDLRPLARRVTGHRRQTIVAEDVVQRRLEVGVAEALDDNSVDVRDLPVDRLRAIDANDGTDSYGRIDRGPEMNSCGVLGFSRSRRRDPVLRS
jgi:hypothetical protein